MHVNSETAARAVIQRLRPSARKHGLRRAVVEAFLREHLSAEFRSASWEDMKRDPHYADVREEAEYRSPPFNPDLSEVYPEDREIIAFEIQDKCPISRSKLRDIRSWVGVLDGCASWSLVLITTNGLGFGWDVLIDTVANGREWALQQFRDQPSDLIRTFPHLPSEASIRKDYRWRNWRTPTPKEFEGLKRTMSFL
jgi:hypothetical protein